MRSKRAQSGYAGTFMVVLGIIAMCSIIAMFVAIDMGRLNRKAHAVSKAIVKEQTSGLKISELYIHKSAPRTLMYFYQTLELREGSDSFPINDLQVVVSTRSTYQVYNYSSRINCSLDPNQNTSFQSISHPNNAALFGADFRYNDNTDPLVYGYLTQQNFMHLCFISPEGLDEDHPVRLVNLPVGGTPLIFEFTTPAVFSMGVIQILPYSYR